ncbi:dITP/XTP pyrophosphatase [Dissostichus eleginoides]|uniref:DITP/XTP pyrophosphatase n=1 Tax=Dissostichus eleginoides TaxID=100907 RepID=A0AAD9FBU0_DISEL|nr:dITP/XTP pyrophosphatase [Dissostichus eleginoides]
MGFPPFLLSVREYRAHDQVEAINNTAETGSIAHSRTWRLKSHTALISPQITGCDPEYNRQTGTPPVR